MTALFIFLSLYLLWLFYLAAMCLIRPYRAGTISKPALVLGYPIVILGVLIDWAVNMVPCTLLFLDIPASWKELVTGRLKRYAYDSRQIWRRKLAMWIGVNLLDTFDPSGKHV